MAFDNTCKFLAETFSQDIATWLLGQSISLTKMEPSELFVEPIRADAMMLLEAEDILLHVEFQTDPDPEMGFRMADYRLRAYRRYPHKSMRQIVVYLRQTESGQVYETEFSLPEMNHRFEVICLWEQSSEQFLTAPGLLPFAVLGQTCDPEQILRDVAQQAKTIEDRTSQANVLAASGILAGLLLDEAIIHQVLRRDMMRESVIYQEIVAEGEARGEARGKIEEGRALALRLLKRRLGPRAEGHSETITPELESQIQQLSLSALETLAEDLLDFESERDLLNWLRSSKATPNS